MDKLEKLWEIAERYSGSKPVSGDWNTETEHELNATANELGISKQEAKDLMINELGFDEKDFEGIKIASARKIRSCIDYDAKPIKSASNPGKLQLASSKQAPDWVKNSVQQIKSSTDTNDLHAATIQAIPYEVDAKIIDRDDKLVIQVKLFDNIKKIRDPEVVADTICTKLEGNNRFMQKLVDIAGVDKPIELIIVDPDLNERIASYNL